MTDGANGCMAICIGDSVVACVMLCYKSNHSLFSVYNVYHIWVLAVDQ